MPFGKLKSDRLLGTLSPTSGNTGTGSIRTTYTAPENGGEVQIIANGRFPNGAPMTGGTNILVEVQNLAPLDASPDYNLIGATTTHPINHFGNPALNAALANSAAEYKNFFDGDMISINDMSLEWGGLFDIEGNWTPPHRSHRFGRNADIRFVPQDRRPTLEFIFSIYGLTTLTEGDHMHVTLGGLNQ